MEIKRNPQAAHVLSQYKQTEEQQREPFYSGKTVDSCIVGSGYIKHKTVQKMFIFNELILTIKPFTETGYDLFKSDGI